MRILLLLILSSLAAVAHGQSPEDLIFEAGQASTEAERYALLDSLSRLPDLDPALRADLGRLLPIVDRWANDLKYWSPDEQDRAAENGYLCGFFNSRIRPERNYPPRVGSSSPLYPIWATYRARMLIHRSIQSGGIRHDEALRSLYWGEADSLLRVAADAYPDNRIVRMYLGKAIPWSPVHAPDPVAPEWANLQREALEKLGEIIDFWIQNRLAPDGQLGGGWGDDVEMWRNWTPILIGFRDPVIREAQARIANGLFGLSRMSGGYTSRMSDVEHTGEDSGDTITSMMHLVPEDDLWKSRALRLVELMRDLWTGTNERGHLQFKSTYFTSDAVHSDPARACDTVYHPRAVQPALLYWQRTADPELTTLFASWMDTWVDAASREERGKPAGVIPSAIHWPDGRIGGLRNDWWDPRNHSETSLYRWPSAIYQVTSTLLLTHYMTGESRYLDPIRRMAEMRAEYLANPVENPEPGSAAWCASKMGFLSDTLAKFRQLTGDRSYDAFLESNSSGYVRYRLTGDREALLAKFRRNRDGFSVNRDAFTSEVRYTDRLFAFNSRYFNAIRDTPVATPDTGFLYSSVTGDPGNPLYFPMNAVQWSTTARDIAVLVTDSGRQGLTAELYHFGDDVRRMGAEFYLLESGKYQLAIRDSENTTLSSVTFEAHGPRTSVPFDLPSRTTCTLTVSPADTRPTGPHSR